MVKCEAWSTIDGHLLAIGERVMAGNIVAVCVRKAVLVSFLSPEEIKQVWNLRGYYLKSHCCLAEYSAMMHSGGVALRHIPSKLTDIVWIVPDYHAPFYLF